MISTPAQLWTAGRRRLPRGAHLSDLGYAAGWRLVRAMPEFVARNAFDAGAWYAAQGGGPGQLRKNLARVIGTTPAEVPDSLVRASLASYARYWREAFRLPTMDLEAVARRLAELVIGSEHVDAAFEAGRGVVLALPHSGNWDMAGVWLVHHSGTFTTVAERLKPESLYQRFLDYRESLGFEVLPLNGGQCPPMEVLAERLRANRAVCLMADRDLTKSGVQVDLCGEPTRLPAGPAKLAIETGAALLPAHVYYQGDDCVVHIFPPLDCSSGDVGVITQKLADRFGANIAAHPEDWHMLQPQWLADLSDERRARLADGDGRT
ncbi:phosphatidylinositol mannoside acyltransferase [Mycobacterium sp. CVI_P3]|uniref:Phosphatidylinositol mannoside acyltransferase n=1 Tax=Mycobacterium pinniadriaticum TaxID=2994102 RepID=A0ABT3SIF1_9MYCO|nr:phosphatidylinositol mannoside acyltransferase [Mycobacterium pinniadriaticum]MCX2932883.1 phosphatidylinositol mannoside acyltransferase [Mycobacterium pinniadriaticum]MCX2939306.1 phosphatidylinositol mannoside acyltransferase [Mycobacterium pinniadriaticum]